MAKGMNSQKAAKKEPAKSPKEKKEEKNKKLYEIVCYKQFGLIKITNSEIMEWGNIIIYLYKK